MLPMIKSFNGDNDKFYPQFYRTFSPTENLYKNLSGNCRLLPSSEIPNHVLARLTGAVIQEILITFNNDKIENFSEKGLLLK